MAHGKTGKTDDGARLPAGRQGERKDKLKTKAGNREPGLMEKEEKIITR